MTPDALATLEQCLLDALAAPPAEARRLLHGRGRRWPGLEQLTADWLEGVLLVALFREPAADQLDALRDLLRRVAASPAWQGSGAAHLLLQLREGAGVDGSVVGERVGGGAAHVCQVDGQMRQRHARQ